LHLIKLTNRRKLGWKQISNRRYTGNQTLQTQDIVNQDQVTYNMFRGLSYFYPPVWQQKQMCHKQQSAGQFASAIVMHDDYMFLQ